MSGTNDLVDQPSSTLNATEGLACISCGYDLTGVAIGSRCPECGLEVNATIRRGRATTRRQAVVVLLRLGALVIVLFSLTIIDIVFWALATVSGFLGQYGPPDLSIYVVQGVPYFVRMGLAVGLWIVAPRLAAFLVPRDGLLVKATGLGPKQLLSVGLILIGVYAVIRGGAELINQFLSTWPIFSVPDTAGYSRLGDASVYISIVWTVAGLLLLGWPRLRFWLGRDLPRA